jgi:ferredoxin
VLLAAGYLAGALLAEPLGRINPVISLARRITHENELISEGREVDITDASKAWRGQAAASMFNNSIDELIADWGNPDVPDAELGLPEDRAQRKLVVAFLQSEDRDREALRMDLLRAGAETIGSRMRIAVTCAMVFFFAVIWLKLVSLNVRRQRTDFEPDRAKCLSCGRCIDSCPVEHKLRKERAAR